MSLSTWFRDYLYIPLGGSRVTISRKCFNLVVVFLISGLWHGAKLTFIIWGLFHALLLILEHCWVYLRGKMPFDLSRIPAGLRRRTSTLLVFGLVTFGWTFFRSNNFSDACYIITHVGHHASLHEFQRLFHGPFIYVLMFLTLFIIIAETEKVRAWHEAVIQPHLIRRWASYYAYICVMVFYGTWGDQPFIYFQF